MKIQNYILSFSNVEAYDASTLNCFALRHRYDVRQGLSLSLGNMVRGFGFDLQGIHFNNSECAYIAGAFSDGTDAHLAIQRRLVACDNGFAAKKQIRKPHESEKRADWEEFNVQWMLYCVWQKCKGNEDFRKLLLQIHQDVVLVENTTTDKWNSAEIWGCKNWDLVNKRANLATVLMERHKDLRHKERDYIINVETNKINDIGVWKGQNNIGKILMLCRNCIQEGTEPQIDYDLLRRSNIYILGDLLTF